MNMTGARNRLGASVTPEEPQNLRHRLIATGFRGKLKWTPSFGQAIQFHEEGKDECVGSNTCQATVSFMVFPREPMIT